MRHLRIVTHSALQQWRYRCQINRKTERFLSPPPPKKKIYSIYINRSLLNFLKIILLVVRRCLWRRFCWQFIDDFSFVFILPLKHPWLGDTAILYWDVYATTLILRISFGLCNDTLRNSGHVASNVRIESAWRKLSLKVDVSYIVKSCRYKCYRGKRNVQLQGIRMPWRWGWHIAPERWYLCSTTESSVPEENGLNRNTTIFSDIEKPLLFQEN
jgi:hypothetical protein